MGCEQQRVKNRIHQQAEAKRIRNRCGLTEMLYQKCNIFKEFKVREAMPTTQQLKDAFNFEIKIQVKNQPESPVFWNSKGVWAIRIIGHMSKKIAAVKNHFKRVEKEDVTFEYFQRVRVERICQFLARQERHEKQVHRKQIGLPQMVSALKGIIGTLRTIFSNLNSKPLLKR